MTRRNKLKKLAKKLVPAAVVVLTASPFVAYAPQAQAFFPPVFPGSPPVAVVPPTVPPPVIVVPPVVPPPVVVPPVVPPPVIVVPPHCPPPNGVPEPATLISALVGLGAVAVRKKMRAS
jgi:hypothetical protein